MARGTFGEIKVFEDFLHFEDNIAATGAASAIVPGTGYISVGELGFVSDDEGELAWTIDEPGGILSITTDSGDDDNACLIAGRFQPGVDGVGGGGCEMEARFKHNTTGTVQLAIYAGFSETMSFTAPVVPAEMLTATVTYNGTGGMMGAMIDPDATTDDWRAVAGDAAAGAGGSGTTGVRANEVITADEWYIVRTEIDQNGNGRVYVGHKGPALDLIQATDAVQGNSWTGAVVTPGDQQYAVLICENRSAAVKIMEVDYMMARGWRDWRNN